MPDSMHPRADPIAAEPAANKREYRPFSVTAQTRFAELWTAARNEQGRPPYARDFLAEYAEALKKIGVFTTADVHRIRDCVSKNGLLTPWNKARKRAKSGGKRRQ